MPDGIIKLNIGELPESLQRSYAERQKISKEKKATRSMFEEAGLTPAPKSRENLWNAAAADTMSKAQVETLTKLKDKQDSGETLTKDEETNLKALQNQWSRCYHRGLIEN